MTPLSTALTRGCARVRVLLLISAAALLMFTASAGGCTQASDTGVACDASTQCGFGETCTAGICTSRSCATSAQCPMEQSCEGGTCAPGCSEDTDCYPTDACDQETGSCTAAACVDSQLDCAFKEFCDSTSGDCYEASGYYCGRCSEDADCGGNGNVCLSFGSNGTFCGVTCGVESDCPSGFTCVEVADSTGNPISSQCITYCWLYDQDDRRAAVGGPAADRVGQLDPVAAAPTALECAVGGGP